MIKSIFNWFATALERSTMNEYDRYLHSATDLVDLEQRMRYAYQGWGRRPEDWHSNLGVKNLIYVRGY